MTAVKEKCPYCGKDFIKVAQHLPYCEVYKLQKEADANIQDVQIIQRKGSEITVPASSTAGIKPDKFWAWTEGLGLQIGVLIGSTDHIVKNAKDIREWCGNMNVFLKEQLNALNTGMADLIDLQKESLKYHKLRLEAIKNTEKSIDSFLNENKQEIKNLTPEKSEPTIHEEDFETYEATLRLESQKAQAPKEDFVTADTISYKTDDSLPEHTRKLKGKILIITPKALQIEFANGKEVWIPKSTVHSDTDELNVDDSKNFIIDSWVLKKNGVIGEED